MPKNAWVIEKLPLPPGPGVSVPRSDDVIAAGVGVLALEVDDVAFAEGRHRAREGQRLAGLHGAG